MSKQESAAQPRLDTHAVSNDAGSTPSSTQLSVAIVGCGYAGLALACALRQMSPHGAVDATIFEAAGAPTRDGDGEVVGDIRVPSAGSEFRSVGMGRQWDEALRVGRCTKEAEARGDLPRRALLSALRDGAASSGNNAASTRVLYKRTVIGIRSDSNDWHGRLECVVVPRHMRAAGVCGPRKTFESSLETYGPFDVVVGADGVLSVLRKMCCTLTFFERTGVDDVDWRRVALIGDALWVQDRWWDFGVRRIRRGADEAIKDGVELGLMLSRHVNSMTKKYCGCVPPPQPFEIELGRFCAYSKQRRVRKKQIIVWSVMAFILISVLWSRISVEHKQ